MNFNKVILAGNLTRDVEMRSLPSGVNVGGFGLAVNDRYKDRDGNWQERANFIDCEIFGSRAEAVARYLGKGSPIFIEGKLRFDQWQDKDGNNRSKIKVVVENFEFIGGRDVGDGEPAKRGGKSETPSDYGKPVSADDIPF